MKFLRMLNRANSQKQLSSKLIDQNKENIHPIENIKPHNKIKTQIQSIETIQPETSSTQAQPQSYVKQQEHYEKQILQFLLSSASKPSENFNYFTRQPDITEHMRMVLFNWLIDVHLKYKLHPQTLFITINIIDQYLENQIVYRNELQLVGITALWIAAKYEQTYQVPKISNLVYVCDSTYTDIQILNMQSRILSEINFDFLKVSSYTYYETLKRYTVLNQKDYFLGRYLLQNLLFDVSIRKYSELTVAASIIFFIQKLRGYEFSKEQKIYEFCGINYKQIRACAKQICFIWQKNSEIKQTTSLRQKFYKAEYLEVAKIKITEKISK